MNVILTGKSVEDCDTCYPGFTLTEGACESPCITGEYAKSEVKYSYSESYSVI